MKTKVPPIPTMRERTSTETGGVTRRRFFRQAGATALSWAACTHLDFAQPATLPNPVGYSSISWPPAELNQAMETLSFLGYQGMQLLGWVQEAYAGGKTAELKERLQKLKLSACWDSKSDQGHSGVETLQNTICRA